MIPADRTRGAEGQRGTVPFAPAFRSLSVLFWRLKCTGGAAHAHGCDWGPGTEDLGRDGS